ncbi:protein rolling stone-like [Ruditapes philippinarum]|uniref:protein rolling stone-like n=1 Tax=Ruditapes philippinarum TaxID=129788 RepID=UPI00295B5E98|nr:protein rolling stone-like [Ruditapes philippinarum]XP_060592177.1 protein rolling stone-like [Ruditapes philippinarum]
MMIKLSVRLVRATQEGMVLAQRAVRTYTRYAYYSFRDRKGRQSDGSKASPVDGPRHSLMYSQVEDFLLSQWSDNPVPYAIYRTIVAAFFFIMVFYTSIYGVLGAKAAIMLTYWSFYILVACQILRAVNCWYYISLRKQGQDVKACLQNKRRIKMQWLLHNLGSDAAPLVSVLFWTIAYDGSGVTLVNCTTHGINAVFVLVDTLISRTPVRMLHLYQSSCMGFVYMLFSYIYHLAGGTNHKGEPYIYKPLDYNNNFSVAISTALVSIFLVAPLIHCWIFFLYRFRLFIHRYLKAVEKRVENLPEKAQ